MKPRLTMPRGILWNALAAICLLLAAPGAVFADTKEDAGIFFNAGTENYLQGKYPEAVRDLERAQSLDPENGKVREFIVKILLEASSQSHIRRDYRTAFQYLQKAQGLAPDNLKVREMYQMTQGLLSSAPVPGSGNAVPAVRSAAASAVKPQSPPQRNVLVPAPAVPRKVVPPPAKAARPAHPATAPGRGRAEERILLSRSWAAGAAAVPVALAILLAVRNAALRRLRSRLRELDGNILKLTEEKNTLFVELEKSKERVKYERQIGEQYQRELKEHKRVEEERMRLEADVRKCRIQEKASAQEAEGAAGKGGPREAFLHQQQAKFLEIMEKVPGTEEISSPALDSMRERIALMAENLFEYSPRAAVDFLGKMANNPNPLMRANIVPALARLSSRESLEILFAMHHDADYHVKREVLKVLKGLLQKIEARAVFLDPADEEQVRTLVAEEKTRGEWIM